MESRESPGDTQPHLITPLAAGSLSAGQRHHCASGPVSVGASPLTPPHLNCGKSVIPDLGNLVQLEEGEARFIPDPALKPRPWPLGPSSLLHLQPSLDLFSRSSRQDKTLHIKKESR
ncbi:hypothetical protein CEP54_010293 [Fusarium duplospermum]|uniref:Uncharacterized protein n=1 Tax=Fusarium duplospermum TaxID=1325734 RepID=A0A428PKV5_9HYPO|nr:hypothetical protein CEP54_010293 [Fusarium duplospermum]